MPYLPSTIITPAAAVPLIRQYREAVAEHALRGGAFVSDSA